MRVGFVSGLLVQLLQHLAAEFTIAQRPAALHDVAANEFIIVAEPVAAREVCANFAGGKIEEFGVARDFFQIEHAARKFPRLLCYARIILVHFRIFIGVFPIRIVERVLGRFIQFLHELVIIGGPIGFFG